MMLRSSLFCGLVVASSLCPAAFAEDSFQAVCGSVDGDASVNVADAVYLLNYLFLGGDAPVCDAPVCAVPVCAVPSPLTLADEAARCEEFSKSSVEACRHAAEADFWTSRASCATLGDPEARQRCLDEARAERENASAACQAQLETRSRVCAAAGAEYPPLEIDPELFVDGVDNPYLPLPIGVTFVFESHTGEGTERTSVQVTGETRDILGVDCLVVRETETVEGEVVGSSEEWLAQDVVGNVWCFGERSVELESEQIVDVDSWEAGSDGARAGLCMTATPHVAASYYREFAPGQSEELVEIVAVGEVVTIASGTFENCLKVAVTDLFDTGGVQFKYYAPGFGLILETAADERVELVEAIAGQSSEVR